MLSRSEPVAAAADSGLKTRAKNFNEKFFFQVLHY
jgi:hypothetical protein